MSVVATESPKLAAALEYLRRGISLVPLHEIQRGQCSCLQAKCKSPGKHARIIWMEYQTRLPSEQEVRDWWRRWPNANVGTIMGKVSGLFAVDCDSPEKTKYVLDLCGGSEPVTEIHYASRGPHFIFLYPATGDLPSCTFGPKVEVNSDGKLVVAPPSEHASGKTYTSNGRIPEDAPEALLHAIREEGANIRARITDEELKRLMKGVPQGERHPALIKLVGRWIGKGLTLEEIELQALAWNQRLEPPEPEDNITRRVRSAYRLYSEEPPGEEEPEIIREGDDFTFLFPGAVGISLRRLQPAVRGVEGYISVIVNGKERYWRQFNIASGSQREDYRRLLEKDDDCKGFPWLYALEKVCQITFQEFRSGGAIEDLEPSPAPACQNLIEPLVIPKEATSVLYGDGGTGKSTLALILQLSLASGRALLPAFTPTERMSSLYLDWESVKEEHQDRLAALLNAFNIPWDEVKGRLHYRRMERPLADEAAWIRNEILRLQVGFVVTDSYVQAAGEEAEGSEAASRIMRALRAFHPATSLVITHIPGYDARNEGDRARPYGSVFVRNLPRSTWLIRRGEQYIGKDETIVTLFHTKVNRGRLERPVTLRFGYENKQITSVKQDYEPPEDLKGGMSKWDKVRISLRDGAKTAKEVAERWGWSESYARDVLNEFVRKGMVRRVDTGPRTGPNSNAVYALQDNYHEDILMGGDGDVQQSDIGGAPDG